MTTFTFGRIQAWHRLIMMMGALFLLPVPLQAQNAGISQGFQTTETNLAVGALMSFKSGQPNAVELAASTSVNQLAGIVGENTLVALSSGDKEVQVVTSGVAPVLVSNINGPIKISDKITASPIAGVGMKATTSTQIIGTAQENFDENKATAQTITDRDGTSKNIKIGQVMMQVNITYFNPAEEKKTPLPPFIQELANSIAGHEVSVIRIIICGVILLLGLLSTSILLYTSVRASITSIGRNPLSKNAVYHSLFQMGLIIIGILVASIGAVYLVIKL